MIFKHSLSVSLYSERLREIIGFGNLVELNILSAPIMFIVSVIQCNTVTILLLSIICVIVLYDDYFDRVVKVAVILISRYEPERKRLQTKSYSLLKHYLLQIKNSS